MTPIFLSAYLGTVCAKGYDAPFGLPGIGAVPSSRHYNRQIKLDSKESRDLQYLRGAPPEGPYSTI